MHLYIVGFGNQARSWANNLKDSKASVTIVLRANSSSLKKVGQDFPVITLKEIPENSIIALLTPDETHAQILEELNKNLQKSTLLYAHGHSAVVHGLPNKYPQFNHLLFAPKGIAKAVREYYLAKLPLAAAISLEYSHHHSEHLELLANLAKLLGITELCECTFIQETQADLFSEQSILCSLLPYAANMSFNKLREKGIPKEIAYLECWYEVKLIADTMVKMGPEKFFDLISPNALYGSELGKNALLGNEFQSSLSELFEAIESGQFDQDVKKTDMKEVRENVKLYWKDQELTSVHNELGPKLFPPT